MNKPSVGSKETWRFLPIGIALILLLWTNVLLVAFRISNPWPNSPWESATLCDAWRAAHHQNFYQDPSKAPVPLMYGPLEPVCLGKIMSVLGFNFYTGRILSLFSAFLVTGLVAFFLTRKCPPLHFWGAWIFLAGINLQCKNYFVETRPDMAAILFSLIALLMFYHGHSQKKWAFSIAGSLLLVIAFFFKQTMAMFSVVPLLVCFLETRSPDFRRNLLMAHLPLVVLLISIGAIKFGSPWLYHYMIGVNAGNRFQPLNLFKRGLELFAFAPLFLVAAWDWLESGKNKFPLDSLREYLKIRVGSIGNAVGLLARSKRGASPQRAVTSAATTPEACAATTPRAMVVLAVSSVGSAVKARCGDSPASPPWIRPKHLIVDPTPIFKYSLTRWMVACLGVTVPACIITAAPSGGDVNALIPAWLVLGAFCIHRSSRFLQMANNPRLLTGILLGFLILIPIWGHPHSIMRMAFSSHGDLHYPEVVSQAASLQGKVVCPQDPTIPLFAKGDAGRSLYAELAHGITLGEWPHSLPQPVLNEMASADYMIQMRSEFGGNRISDGLLRGLHFHPLPILGLEKSCYSIWKKN